MKITVFNDLACIGNCSLKVNTSVLMQNGVEVITIPTKIFSSLMDYSTYITYEMPRFSELTEAIEKKQNECDVIYIGFYDSREQLDVIKNFIQNTQTKKTILDPIFGDNGILYSGSKSQQVDLYKELLSSVDVVTPNLTEALFLSEYKKNYENLTREDVEKIAKKIFEIGVKEIIIKGFNENGKLNTLHYDGEFSWFEVEKVETKICGTGDAFSSLVALEIARERNLKNSIDKIQNLILNSIKNQKLTDGLNEIDTSILKLN